MGLERDRPETSWAKSKRTDLGGVGEERGGRQQGGQRNKIRQCMTDRKIDTDRQERQERRKCEIRESNKVEEKKASRMGWNPHSVSGIHIPTHKAEDSPLGLLASEVASGL